jgi:hypothetical protein
MSPKSVLTELNQQPLLPGEPHPGHFAADQLNGPVQLSTHRGRHQRVLALLFRLTSPPVLRKPPRRNQVTQLGVGYHLLYKIKGTEYVLQDRVHFCVIFPHPGR